MTHYKDHSYYCPGPGDCRFCQRRDFVQWKGYFAAEFWDPKNKWWMPTVAEITEACELDLRNRFRRGQVWIFTRPEPIGKKKLPMSAKLVKELPEKTLPPEFNIYPVLYSVYHTQNIVLNVKNPLPDRVMVEPTTGDAPEAPPARPAAPTIDAEERARLIALADSVGLGKPRSNGHHASGM